MEAFGPKIRHVISLIQSFYGTHVDTTVHLHYHHLHAIQSVRVIFEIAINRSPWHPSLPFQPPISLAHAAESHRFVARYWLTGSRRGLAIANVLPTTRPRILAGQEGGMA